MGLLSASLSVARYRVEGDTEEESLLETVREGLTKNAISEIEDEYAEIAVGWTPFESPFDPDFEKFSYTFGTYFLFSLRIDKKSVPGKIIQKHTAMEITKRLKESGRDFLSRNEKTDIKDTITEKLMRQMPSTPNLYDVLWIHEDNTLLFLTTQKAANEELETLFKTSFKRKLIRLFPFTMVEGNPNFSDKEKDLIANLGPVKFSR